MKKSSLLAGALLVLLPLTAILPGCGGGGSGVISPTSTAAPTPTPLILVTPTPNGSVGATQTSNLILGNGQRATLNFAIGGTSISGTLEVLDAPPNLALTKKTKAKTQAYNGTIFAGTYIISGSLTPPLAYNVIVTDDGITQFGLRGQLPTTTKAGTYTLYSGSGSEDGILNRVGAGFPTPTPLPTSTPAPTPKPTASAGPLNVNLTLTPSSDSDIKITPLPQKQFFTEKHNGTDTLIFGARGETSDKLLAFNIFLDDVKQGKEYRALGALYSLLTSGYYGSNKRTHGFQAIAGTVTVTSLTATTATIVLKDVTYSPLSTPNAGTGTIVVNGTVSGAFARAPGS